MKVKMLLKIEGTRDGVAYPDPGETLELPDDEGAKLCAAGYAEPVAQRAKPETAVAREAEAREEKAPAKKAAAKKKAG